nr:DUF3459 domain-containing protein [Marinicella sp. W31]MDC2878046.1 DUF3459 domain-containing protein [Marinicella sp. W31]
MQWDASENAGFTTAEKPWLAINPNYPEINAEAARSDESSIYHHYRRLIALRHHIPALTYGTYEDLAPDHETVFAFERKLDDVRLVTVINFSREPETWSDARLEGTAILISNDTSRGDTLSDDTLTLSPWEAVVLRLPA